MKKYCIVGSHGAGKTTLAYQMAAYYKTLGLSVKLINETARSCPFPLNEKFTAEGAIWIAHSHIKKELEAIAGKSEIIVCDRSAIDSLMYAKANNIPFDEHLLNLERLTLDWMRTYTAIYYVRSGSAPILGDGVRSVDEDFRQVVEDYFDQYIGMSSPYSTKYKLNIKVIPSSDIFTKRHCWIAEDTNRQFNPQLMALGR